MGRVRTCQLQLTNPTKNTRPTPSVGFLLPKKGQIMTASEQIFTLLSPLVGGKCYPLIVPETQANNPPYIVYQLVSTEPHNTADGITAHEWVRMQVDIYSSDYDELLTLTVKAIRQLDTIDPSEYMGHSVVYDDGLFRSVIEYGLWQTLCL